jgi:hypothetical protein
MCSRGRHKTTTKLILEEEEEQNNASFLSFSLSLSLSLFLSHFPYIGEEESQKTRGGGARDPEQGESAFFLSFFVLSVEFEREERFPFTALKRRTRKEEVEGRWRNRLKRPLLKAWIK